MLATTLPSTTVAILTPSGRGAVAVASVRGAEAVRLVSKFFAPRNADAWQHAAIGQVLYGGWTSNGGAMTEENAEDVIVCRVANDSIEIHCHGGIASTRIVEDLASAGAQVCDWSTIAFADERNPIQTAARIALADAVTERTAEILLDQLNGALETAIRTISATLETDASAADSDLQTLLDRAPVGLHLTSPWRVVIAGAPNVGKSSLVNAFLGYNRALVFDQPGTTRDIVEATTSLDGWPVTFADTAGLRTTADALEIAGIERAQNAVAEADCLILVFDASQPWTKVCQDVANAWPNAIIVHNKADLQAHERPIRPDGIRTSALRGTGIDQLTFAIVGQLVDVEIRLGDAVPFRETQVEQLQIARSLIAGQDLSAAKSALLALLGPR
jgi:tRNA modification GTPase